MTHSFPTRRSSDLLIRHVAADRKTVARIARDRGDGAVGQRHRAGTRNIERPRIAPRPRHLRQELRAGLDQPRSEEHTSELQSLMRNSYAVICLKKKTTE